MARRLLTTIRLGSLDRHVISLLRGGGWPGREPEGGTAAFRTLAQQAAAAGYVLLPPNALPVDEHEFRLLGWLALLQRRRRDFMIDERLVDSLAACADKLSAAGFWLRFRGATRNDPRIGDASERASRDLAPAFGGSARRAWVLNFVRQRGTVHSRELVAVGVSRQHVGQLYKIGLLRRVSRGLYEVSGEAGGGMTPGVRNAGSRNRLPLRFEA